MFRPTGDGIGTGPGLDVGEWADIDDNSLIAGWRPEWGGNRNVIIIRSSPSIPAVSESASQSTQ